MSDPHLSVEPQANAGGAPDTPSSTPASPITASSIAAVRRPLGLIFPTVVLLAYWIITEASYRMEMGMFYRFVTRMLTLLITIVFFLFWGLSRRHFTWGQRLLALALILGTMSVAGAVSHPATGPFATAMMGLPIVITFSIGWLWLTRQRAAGVELSGIAVICLLVFGAISLLRWDGMDGRQRPELSWRWTPNAEAQFLQQVPQAPEAVEGSGIEIEASPADWTSFRGDHRRGVVSDVTLGDWSSAPPREVWRHRVGPGWSSMIAVGDYLFTQEQRDDHEAIVCYQLQTGNEIWHSSGKGSKERFSDSLSGSGPRATPTYFEHKIYSYGARGHLDCVEASTGKNLWSHSIFELAGAKVPQWGSASSPTIVDDLVLVFAGGENGSSIIAFDRLSGDLRWKAPGGTVSYSTPQIMSIAGQRQIVMHDDRGLTGLRIADGKLLWTHLSPHGASFQPMLQPHQIADDQLLVNWDSGLLCLRIRQDGEQWSLQELWKSNRLKPSFNEFVIHDGFIYGLDDGILCCLDLATQQRKWKKGRYGFGQMLLIPESKELLILGEQGDVIRVAADPEAHRELGQFKAISGKTWNHPIIAQGRLVVRNAEEMACFDICGPATRN